MKPHRMQLWPIQLLAMQHHYLYYPFHTEMKLSNAHYKCYMSHVQL